MWLLEATGAPMGTKTGVMIGVASTGSALAIAASLLVVGLLVRDINTLQREILQEMADFKAVANDAWHGMILMQGHEPSGLDVAANPRLQFASIFKREKRGYASGGGSYASPQCNCGRQASNCPSGPPGPMGAPGYAGEDGTPGQPGRMGAPGSSLIVDTGYPGCIQCPPGPMGMQGPPGSMGAPGSSGAPGMPGAAGRSGGQGPMGPPGDMGASGYPGEAGQPGAAGEPGTRSTPIPGPPGALGPMGPMGQANRWDRPDLRVCSRVHAAAHSRLGSDGTPGSPGQGGSPGVPGADASYCKCPTRAPPPPVYQPAPAYRPAPQAYRPPPPQYG
ncbi:Cuticle collagen dpy-5 [Aphelenchoides fujianensis]|nr:Cuticle collagen dpy-5 [Aphelenchoides fujianensis]